MLTYHSNFINYHIPGLGGIKCYLKFCDVKKHRNKFLDSNWLFIACYWNSELRSHHILPLASIWTSQRWFSFFHGVTFKANSKKETHNNSNTFWLLAVILGRFCCPKKRSDFWHAADGVVAKIRPLSILWTFLDFEMNFW